MKNGKRMLSLLLAVVLVAVMCPVIPAQAAETMSAEVCPCCGKAFNKISWTSYSKWTNMMSSGSMFSKAGHYKLSDSFTMKKEYTISANVVLDFNGLKLQAASGKRGFTVKSGGTLTLINTGGANGRLEGHNTSSEGVAIKVEEGGTLNILSGRVVGKSTSYNGGAIYNAGTVNMAGGKIDSGKSTSKNGGNVYNAGTFNMYGGSILNGNAKLGGNVCNTGTFNAYGGEIDGGVCADTGDGGNICNSGTLNIEGATINGGTVTGDDGYGGNIYNRGTVNMKDGAVSGGTANDHGGNIFNAKGGKIYMYGGTITGGVSSGVTKTEGEGESATTTVAAGNGGNIYITQAVSVFEMHGGIITGGSALTGSGGNVALLSGVQGYMYGGTIERGTAATAGNVLVSGSATNEDNTKTYSALYVLGGEIISTEDNDLAKSSVNNLLKMYNCRYTGTMDISPFVAECCCCVSNGADRVVWNAGYRDGTCTDCLYAQAIKAGLATPVNGGHNYELTGENTYTCTGCGKVSVFETVAATINGDLFATAEEAFAAANPGDKLTLMANAAIRGALAVNYTLDLNGYLLQVDTLTSAIGGDLIDSSRNSAGALECHDVTLAQNNSYLPVKLSDGIHFCQVGFTQWIDAVDTNTAKVKFYFTQRSQETIIDDAILEGNTELDVQIHLTWTDSKGQQQDKTFLFGNELMQKYAEKWNGRVFVTTITGTSNITNLTCSYQVTSKAASGVELSAKSVKYSGFINDVLSWEKINSYPIKTENMTVEEMRQLCLDFMIFNKTYLWTPSEDVLYIRNSSGSKDAMYQGTIYGGLPYVGVASGNPYRMMDYIDENGIVDMQKAIPALGSADRLAMSDLKYFGSQCSIAVYWAWGRVLNNAKFKWTQNATPYNNFIVLGNVKIPDTVTSWNTTYGTDECVAENGEQAMFSGYAQLKKADGMVYYTTAGHLIMAYSDAVVVYADDGTIDGDQSYIYIIDQAQAWVEGTNEAGDTYQYKSSVAAKKTFAQLFDSNYIPFTFAEFLGTDAVEQTEVSLIKSKTTLISGTIAESDRSFQATTTTNKLTWSQFMSSTVTSNYGVVDVYLIVYDNRGNELYKHAVRTGEAGDLDLQMKETGAMVTTWETKALQSGKTYNAEIVVQLSTGERPTIFNGQLTMDN